MFTPQWKKGVVTGKTSKNGETTLKEGGNAKFYPSSDSPHTTEACAVLAHNADDFLRNVDTETATSHVHDAPPIERKHMSTWIFS